MKTTRLSVYVVHTAFATTVATTIVYTIFTTLANSLATSLATSFYYSCSSRLGDLVATKATVLEEAERSENQTEQMVSHVYRSLIKCWKVDKKPVNFFQFIIDPDSFGQSIENLFHVSFLVKEGKVAISLGDPSQLPHITPLSPKGRGQRGEEGKHQVRVQ